MKQVHATYSFVASTKTITLTGLNIDQDQLLLIVNATRGVQYFNFADSSLRAVVTSGANTSVVLTDASTTGHANGDALVVYYDDQAASQVVSGTVTANPGTGAFTVSGTVGLDNASLVALENITVTVGAAVSVSNFPASQVVTGSVAVTTMPALSISSVLGFNEIYLADADNDARFSSSYPFPISGTVTANLVGNNLGVSDPLQTNGSGAVRASLSTDSQTQVCDDDGNSYTIANPFPISGTVTVAGFSTVSVGGTIGGLVISGNRGGLATNILLDTSTGHLQAIPQVPNGIGGYSNVSDALPLPVKGSVTIGANPSGALTTRFGSVTTANTAQITSAVTNTSRKYLLAQNISAGTVTIGIGFSPTTTQGIQLTAGAGLTFDAFCPTGAVYWLGATTGATWTILEG